MHPDVAAIRRARAWSLVTASAKVLGTSLGDDSLHDRLVNPPVPVYERDARELYRIEAIADLLVALADDTEPLSILPVDADVREALISEGFGSLADIRSADDNTLINVDGIGRATLDAIRTVAPYEAPSPVAVQEPPQETEDVSGEADTPESNATDSAEDASPVGSEAGPAQPEPAAPGEATEAPPLASDSQADSGGHPEADGKEDATEEVIIPDKAPEPEDPPRQTRRSRS